MRMILFHGRTPPEADPDHDDAEGERGGWGHDGPTLLGVKGLYATYGVSTLRIAFENDEYTRVARQLTGWDDWDEDQLVVTWHEDLIRVAERDGFMYYGDWSLVPDETAYERADSVPLGTPLSKRYAVEPQRDELAGTNGDETRYVPCDDDEAEHFAVLRVHPRRVRSGELCTDWDLLQDFPTRYDAEQFIRGQMVLDKYLGAD